MDLEYWFMLIIGKQNGVISSDPNHTQRFWPLDRIDKIQEKEIPSIPDKKPAS